MAKAMRATDFSVGWICALSLEMAAATEILDEEYAYVHSTLYDTNTYTFGRIGEHNVVIALLPSGVMGTNAAASVATQMRTSFPWLRCTMLVGIAGGIPSARHDVRLGDVVISKPTASDSGVVQYDFGKTGPNGTLRITARYLHSPPDILLGALATLESRVLRRRVNIDSHLSGPCATDLFRRPDPEDDVLFKATAPHIGGGSCRGRCGPAVLRAARPSTQPRLFLGTIASGNQVMKDAETRDRYYQMLGEDVLCFEMEAAGVMKNLPTLVVRGICDYADAHKNDGWQPYAAITAAAYAKELLLLVHPSAPLSRGLSDAGMLHGEMTASWRGGLPSPPVQVPTPPSPTPELPKEGPEASKQTEEPPKTPEPTTLANDEPTEPQSHDLVPPPAPSSSMPELSKDPEASEQTEPPKTAEPTTLAKDEPTEARGNDLVPPPAPSSSIPELSTDDSTDLVGDLEASNVSTTEKGEPTASPEEVPTSLPIRTSPSIREPPTAPVEDMETPAMPNQETKNPGATGHGPWMTSMMTLAGKASETDSVDKANDLFKEGEAKYSDKKQQEAEKTFRECLLMRIRLLGLDYASTLSAIRKLADCVHKQNRWSDAEAIYTELVPLQEKILGSGNPEALWSMHNLGNCLYQRGKYSNAESILGRLLLLRKEREGPEHSLTLQTEILLAGSLRRQSKYAEAVDHYNHALPIHEREAGRRDANTDNAKYGLGASLFHLGKLKRAEEVSRDSLSLRQDWDAESLFVRYAQKQLGSCLYAQGRYKSAEKLLDASLSPAANGVTMYRKGVAESKSLLGQCRMSLKKYGEAEGTFRELVELRTKALGDKAPETLEARYHLARSLLLQERYIYAKEMLDSLLPEQTEMQGPNHPDTLRTTVDLVTCLVGLCRHREARHLAHDVLGRLQSSMDESDDDLTMACLYKLGESCRRLKDYDGAKAAFEKCLKLRRRVSGRYHEYTIDVKEQLRQVERKLNQPSRKRHSLFR